MTHCVPLVNEEGKVIGNLTRGPSMEKPIRKRGRWKWCFNCRKRTRHMLTMSYDPHPTYYEPTIWWKCDGCGEDYTLFPGQFYE